MNPESAWSDGGRCENCSIPLAVVKKPLLILASGSPRRAQLLQELEFDFKVIPSDADEADSRQLTARELAELNAYRKARVVAKQHPQAVVFGCDTVVYLGTLPLGKPATRKEAHEMLTRLAGQTHHVVSGCCLLYLEDHRCEIFSETTEVTFRRLNKTQIARYLKKINPLDKAGGYAIQESGEMIVESVYGSFTNVVGLPVETLCRRLQSFGIG